MSFFDKDPVRGYLTIPSMLWAFIEENYPEWYVEHHICANRERHEWAVGFEGLWTPIDSIVGKVRERMKQHLIPVGDEWYNVMVGR